LMIPTLLTATSFFIIAFIAAPPVDIDAPIHKKGKTQSFLVSSIASNPPNKAFLFHFLISLIRLNPIPNTDFDYKNLTFC
jgi:hypothetical protein